MSANKNNVQLDLDNLDNHLGGMGFLYPVNETQMQIFDILFEDFEYKLNDAYIDCDSIIKGYTRKGLVVRLPQTVDENEIQQLRMVARKGVSDLPEDILAKIYDKHRKKP
jgi:hypothetical protein